jgi:uncharacterized protein
MCGDVKSGPPQRRAGLAARAAIGLIRSYQVALSPWLGANCRYLPTCSAYAIEAITRFGLVRGGWLGLRRIGRCHPFTALGAGAGADPVPKDYVWWGRD